MPLVDLKTDLTSLKFGKDRPGGGSSREPFVKGKSLDKRIAEDGIETLASTGGTDMFIRGEGKVLPSIEKDLERLGKYFSTVEGGLFTAQQNLLSATGVRIYGGYPFSITSTNSFRLNDGIYTPASTLAAASGISIGGHPNKQGVDPTGLSIYGRPEYLKLLKGNDDNFITLDDSIRGTSKNRLISLYRKKIKNKGGSTDTELYSYLGGPQAAKGGNLKTIIKTSSDRTFGQYEDFGFGGLLRTNQYLTVEGFEILPQNLFDEFKGNIRLLYKNKLGTPKGQTLYQYNGGIGVGKVNVLVDYQTQTLGRQNGFLNNGALTYSTFNQDQIKSSTPKGNGSVGRVKDFRKDLLYKPTSIISDSPDYNSNKRIEERVNLGDAGARGVDKSNYTTGRSDLPQGLDKINSLYLYRSENVTTDSRKNDLVKFRIATIDNDNPKIKTFTHFRAFLTSINDNMSATWNNFKYTGRGENFYTYQGFSNSYNLGFTVVAQSKPELSIMYQKLNYLKSTLAPDYSADGYMRGNIHQLTIGGYLYEMPGIIESFNIAIPEDTTWEIGINTTGGSDSTVKEMPHRVNVSMDFKPIYKFLPQTIGSGLSSIENPNGIFGAENITQRFISLEDADGKSVNNLYNDGIDDRFLTQEAIAEKLGNE